MGIDFVNGGGTRFRVRVEQGDDAAQSGEQGKDEGAAPVVVEMTAGLEAKGQEVAASGSHLAFLIATDPPNVVEHYDDLIEAMRETFPGSAQLIFELPTFGLSASSQDTMTGLAADMTALVDIVANELVPERRLVLVLPSLGGLMAVPILRDAAAGAVDALVVVQCADYKGEREWANQVNSSGALSSGVVARLINYMRCRAIASGWYSATFPRRGDYSECSGLDQAGREKARRDVTGATITIRDHFRKVANAAFDKGATFPLAWFLQSLFFSPSLVDKPLIDLLEIVPESADEKPVAVPTLVVWGPHDSSHRVNLETDAKKGAFRRYARDCTVELCAGSGHYPELQQPRAFAAKLANFLETRVLKTLKIVETSTPPAPDAAPQPQTKPAEALVVQPVDVGGPAPSAQATAGVPAVF